MASYAFAAWRAGVAHGQQEAEANDRRIGNAFAAWRAGVAHGAANPPETNAADEQLSAAFEAWKGLNSSDLAAIVGTWKIESFYIRKDDDGSVAMYPFGEHPKGWLLYTDAGIMSGCLMKSEEDGRSLEEPSDSEGFAAAFLTTLFYSGAFTVDEAEGVVKHQVQAASYPNWVNTELLRRYTFSDDGQMLTLSTDDKCPPGMTAMLVWSRVTST